MMLLQKPIIFILVFAGCLVFACGDVSGFDAEKNHPGLTNEIVEKYIELFGNTLSNGTSLDTVMTGEVVTSSGTLKTLSLKVRDWIILGSAEEDWGGIRAEAHYYDAQQVPRGRSSFSSGAVAWIHSSTQTSNYVAATGQSYASGDYTFETFRSLYWNSPNDYRTYKTFGHLLHVLADMASPPHVRGLDEESRLAFESRLKNSGSVMLTEILAGSAVNRTGYLSQNRSALGISAITAAMIPSHTNPDNYYTELASYVSQNFFTQQSIYAGTYSQPPTPSVPPVFPAYTAGDYSTDSGDSVPGYTRGGIFVLSRSAMLRKDTSWNGLVHLSPANHVAYYQKLAPVIVRYGVGLIRTATTANNAPSLVITGTSGTSGNIELTYTLTDADYDYCSLQPSYSTDGGTTFYAATPGPGGDGVSRIVSSPTGTSHTFYWNSSADISSTGAIVFALVPVDVQTGTGDTENLTVSGGGGSAPSVTLTTPSTTKYGHVTISYKLVDAELNVCSIQVFYSEDGGVTFSAATQGIGGDGVTDLTSATAGIDHTYVWDSASDIGVTSQADIRIRIIASDATAGAGPAGETSDFSVDNVTARVVVSSPTTTQSGFVTISYTIFDNTSAPKDITVEYSDNGGVTFNPSTAGVGGDGVLNLTSGPYPGGVTHTYVWDTVTDLGYTSQSDIRFKITPSAGVAGETENFTLNNVNPQIVFVNPSLNSYQNDPVPVTFTFEGPDVPGGVDITVEYSTVAALGPYSACTLSSERGYALTGVTPQLAASQYTFWWDSKTDLGAEYYDPTVWIRITIPAAYFGGLTVTSDVFELSHKRLAQSAWPKAQGPDLNNTGRTPYRGPDFSGVVNAVKWTTGGLYTAHSSPVIGPDGTVYVQGYHASYGYGLFAVNPVTGAIKWFFQNPRLADWRYNTPAVGNNDTVYVALTGSTEYEYVHAVNVADGSAKWTSDYYVGRTYTPNGLVIDKDGTIYINGYQSGQNTWCYAIVDNGQGAAPSDKWAVYNTASANVPYGTPIVDETNNNVIFSMDYNNKLVALNRATGALVWYENLGNDASWDFRGTKMIAAGQLFARSRARLGAYAIDQTGDIGGASWSTVLQNPSDAYYAGPAAGWDDTVYYIDINYIKAINGATHAAKWNFELRGECDGTPVIEKDGVIYVLGGSYLQAIRDNGGSASELWYYNNGYNYGTGNRREQPAIGSDNSVYVSAPNATRDFRSIGSWVPTVQDLSPGSLPASLGGKIRLYGGNFKNQNGDATAVKLKTGTTEIDLTFTVVNYTTIVADVPTGLAPGVYDIYVTAPSPGGTNTSTHVQLTVTNY